MDLRTESISEDDLLDGEAQAIAVANSLFAGPEPWLGDMF